jgi:hypothetical protein
VKKAKCNAETNTGINEDMRDNLTVARTQVNIEKKTELRARLRQEEQHKAAKQALVEGDDKDTIVKARASAYAATLVWKEHLGKLKVQ